MTSLDGAPFLSFVSIRPFPGGLAVTLPDPWYDADGFPDAAFVVLRAACLRSSLAATHKDC